MRWVIEAYRRGGQFDTLPIRQALARENPEIESIMQVAAGRRSPGIDKVYTDLRKMQSDVHPALVALGKKMDEIGLPPLAYLTRCVPCSKRSTLLMCLGHLPLTSTIREHSS